MRYEQVRKGIFLARPNRFIAHVLVDDTETVCHVKNTGRCRELLVPGAAVYLEKGTNPNRKTAYDLIAVEKNGKLINMDAQAPNKVFAEWALQFDPTATAVHSEYRFGQSRLDFCLETPRGLHLVEVKGVTLEEDGTALFPDAPTLRGIKHLEGLSRAAAQGFACCVLFVVQFSPAAAFAPNRRTHPAFADALRAARDAGVRVLAYDCAVTPESMVLRAPVPVTGL